MASILFCFKKRKRSIALRLPVGARFWVLGADADGSIEYIKGDRFSPDFVERRRLE
jgi:hypothetical protein